jgi:hypothetical protein
MYNLGYLFLCFLFGMYFRSYGMDLLSIGIISFTCAMGCKHLIEKLNGWIKELF